MAVGTRVDTQGNAACGCKLTEYNKTELMSGTST
jgi:hypothetical protein